MTDITSEIIFGMERWASGSNFFLFQETTICFGFM